MSSHPSTDDNDDDPRLAFVYAEALRGLTHQQGVVDSMNARAGSLIFATAFANSLLGSAAIANGLALWDWAAVVLLFCIGGLIVILLWPYYQYRFRFDPEALLATYVDGDRPTTMPGMHRALALQIKADMAGNWRIVQRLRLALQVGLVLLLLNILAWLLAIAGV